ncbi:Vacuolar ATP synthase subunit C [Phlyctochytrium bullatum]|nr:Vacuolar ATP synthase subunit C [Phlyctochytrium bullatum]
MASPLFLLAAPADPTKAETAAKLRDKIASKSADYAELVTLTLPDFKVGTLDSLVLLSDELQKADTVYEGITVKIAENMKTLLGGDLERWKSNLVWNTMKYRADKSLKELTDMIAQEVASIDTLMKSKMQTYTGVKTQLASIQRKQGSLNGIVKKEHFVLDSEYLTTLMVAVPNESDWVNSKISEDDEYALYSVTMFIRVVDEFTQKAREKRFIVRDFKWNDEQLAKEKKEAAETANAEKELLVHILLSRSLVIRLYVESVLRYGLPPDFQAMIIKAKPRQEKKTRDVINAHYAKLGGVANSKDGDEPIEENLQMLLGEKDYCPAVLLNINPFWSI